MTDHAMLSPSKVLVPRPISSRITKERSSAWLSIVAVSLISTMNVDCPLARLSEAPTRLKSLFTTPIFAEVAGTKDPICAIIVIIAFCRKKVDLPEPEGPITTTTSPFSIVAFTPLSAFTSGMGLAYIDEDLKLIEPFGFNRLKDRKFVGICIEDWDEFQKDINSYSSRYYRFLEL